MKTFKTYTDIPPNSQGAVVAMGNFDGVHLGHQSVIALARAIAATTNAPLGIITFEPHPRQLFAPDAPAFRLMSEKTRAHRLNKLGIDALFEIPFNKALSGLTAEEFARDVLANGLHIKHVIIGADFRFGKGREGDASMLCDLGQKLGFGVTVAPLISDDKGDYSSSAIREALSTGHPEDAARMLGHWHRIDGIVEKGDQRGRELGFPTANISLDDLHLPKFGVYAVFFDVLSGPHKGVYRGAASLGIRPTFGINKPNLETFLFDFSGDIYDASVSVALVAYQRPEEKFDNLEDLIKQMNIDCFEAREILEKATA
ncbi:MAG: bifunctional riboflavin kinase/FMN adenylyltransferase [Rhodobacteraceae bacterium]|nr:MAG: bifunctional riboflavin kinase/FMN adenylyltransferase [Paracoccaceae bacterium]